MLIRNFLEAKREWCGGNDGVPPRLSGAVIEGEEFDTPIRFVRYSTLPKGACIAPHTHGDDNELYIILSGDGIADDGTQRRPVRAGDILVNPPFGAHALYNESEEPLNMLVIEVFNPSEKCAGVGDSSGQAK